MADFLNKIGNAAKNLGEKASDSIDVGKLNSKIKSEQAAINESMRQIGEYFYSKHTSGEPDDPGAAQLFAEIDGHHQTIASLKADIERVKSEVKE
jgi:hypothetical protein